MHCKHCGNKIEDDSNFCSFCGGKVDLLVQPTTVDQQDLNYTSTQNELSNKTGISSVEKASSDIGLLVVFCVMVSLQVFWVISNYFIIDHPDLILEQYQKFILKPSYVIFNSIPLLIALFSKRKVQRLILLIVGLIFLGWSIYMNFII